MTDIITTYSLTDHAAHMRQLLATRTMEDVVTCGDLIGEASFDDERLMLLTRNFIQQNRNLGLKVADLDKEIAARRRAERAAKRAAAQVMASSPADNQTDLYQWIEECCGSWGVRFTAAGALVHPELNAVGALDALVVLNSQRPPGMAFKDNAIRAGFARVQANHRLERLDEIRQHISTDRLNMAAEHVMTLFVDVMTLGLDASCPFTADEAAQIICKVIWMTKRNLLGMPVTRHIMPVFTGPQQGGKSLMVAALTDPVEELRVSIDLKTLTDERQTGLFESYIGVADELDKAERASVESLKRIITETSMDRRVMRSNGTVKIVQNLSFIGTSNRDVSEVIVDDTGNRRFISLPIQGTAAGPDRQNQFWDHVNSFDWLNLWRAVDPTGADPTMPIWEKIQQVQASERSKSNIELWIEDAHREPDSFIFSGWTATSDLYRDYRTWEIEFSPRAETSFGFWSKAFARTARHGGVPFEPKARNNAKGYVYTGNSDDDLAGEAKEMTKLDRLKAQLKAAGGGRNPAADQ